MAPTIEHHIQGPLQTKGETKIQNVDFEVSGRHIGRHLEFDGLYILEEVNFYILSNWTRLKRWHQSISQYRHTKEQFLHQNILYGQYH